MNNPITISNNNGSLTVSSVQVAENFGKQHKHVLEALADAFGVIEYSLE